MTRLRRCLFLLTPFMLLIEAPHVNQESLRITPGGTKKVVKRQTACPDGEYYSGLHCCKLCTTGTHKISDCVVEHGNPYCTSCRKGIEYDKDQECHRCTICDPGEDPPKLYSKENTKCQCIEGYFCNATSRCTHCEPCDKCENGRTLEKCTRQKNTLCEENHRKRTTVLAAIVVTVLGLIVAAAAAVLYCRKETNLRTPHPGNSKEIVHLQDEQSVDLQEKYPDVDLTQHFAAIAEILDLSTTLSFVRKNGMTEPTIDQIRMDNHLHTNEQKVQLVRKWYEEHGKPRAFATLIGTLTKMGYRSSAEKILEQIAGA